MASKPLPPSLWTFMSLDMPLFTRHETFFFSLSLSPTPNHTFIHHNNDCLLASFVGFLILLSLPWHDPVSKNHNGAWLSLLQRPCLTTGVLQMVLKKNLGRKFSCIKFYQKHTMSFRISPPNLWSFLYLKALRKNFFQWSIPIFDATFSTLNILVAWWQYGFWREYTMLVFKEIYQV